jgi:hypothetical protein
MDMDESKVETDETTDDETVASDATSRRSLLSKGAIAAAVGAAAGLAVSSRGMAATGATLHAGELDTATAAAVTGLSGGTTFRVINGSAAGLASIYGTQSGSTGGYGVRGRHTGSSGVGVYGDATGSAGVGVRGNSSASNGIAVYGEHSSSTTPGTGVRGRSQQGAGVSGAGTSLDVLANGSGRIGMIAAPSAPSPTAAGVVGTIARDSAGVMWYCFAANQWMRLGGPGLGGAVQFIAPARVYDSRNGAGKILPTQNRDVDCTANASGVPATAKGVILNLTAANTTGLGNLAVYPDGSPAPATSSINYTPGVNIANSTSSGCGPGAKIRVQCGGSTGCDFIVDIVGFYL